MAMTYDPSNGVCSSSGYACFNSEENLINTIHNIQSIEDCHQLCSSQKGCAYVSYFSENSDPLSHVCMLFKYCDQTSLCTNCITEWIGCDRNCLKSIVKTLDENIIDIKPFTPSYKDCRGHCADTEGCSWFTFFNHDDEILSDHCFLLSEEGGTNPEEKCENCVSGPVECQPNDCTMDIGDGKAAAITEVNKHHTVTITAGQGVCTLTLLVVGGGGSGNDCQSGYSTCGDGGGGGGSGYIKYMSMTLGQGVHKISAFVGDGDISSNVTVSGDMIYAHHGGTRQNSGGNGYSGGGAPDIRYGENSYGAAGGYDGWKGHGDRDYGQGSGKNVRDYTFDSFLLAPGEGGAPDTWSGGGGGGVLVNGRGPEGSNIHQGQGYGGGGPGVLSRQYNDKSNGRQGIVLLELSDRQ